MLFRKYLSCRKYIHIISKVISLFEAKCQKNIVVAKALFKFSLLETSIIEKKYALV